MMADVSKELSTNENDREQTILMKNLTGSGLLSATVVGIRWERVTVTFDVKVVFSEEADRTQPLVFYAVNGAFQARAVFRQEGVEGDLYTVSLNVTNPGNARCVPTGNYSMVICQRKNMLAVAETDVPLALRLQEFSRNFLYGGKARRKTYAVTFLVKEWAETLPFVMHILHAKDAGMGDIYAPAKKKPSFMDQQKKSITAKKRKYAFKLLQDMYDHYRKKYRNNKKTILFLYEANYNMASNLRAVQKRIKERGLDREFTILEYAWFADMPSVYNKSERLEHQRALAEYLARANIIFVDNYVPAFTRMRLDLEHTTIINLWHAGIGFKAVGYSRWGHLAASAPFLAHRVYTYGVCGSRQVSHVFAEAWGINPERVLPTGMPRMDKYLDPAHREEKTKELYETFPLCQGKKVILFAPTFRGNNHPDAHYPFEIMDFEKLYEACGDEYVVLFKMHPWISTPVPIEAYSDKFVDVTSYPDINDLFYITDLLITDYSSCIYEFSLMHKPMLFFAFDEMQYSISRGFHHDYRLAAPGKVCNTFEELLTAIREKDFEIEKVEAYIKRNFDIIDSGSSDRVIDWFLLGQIPEQYVREIEARDEEMRLMAQQLDFSLLQTAPSVSDEADEDGEELTEEEGEPSPSGAQGQQPEEGANGTGEEE